MNWTTEVWTRWHDAVRESNESSPAALKAEEAEKWKGYEERLERELDAAREEYRIWRRKTCSALVSVTQSLVCPRCEPAEHVK